MTSVHHAAVRRNILMDVPDHHHTREPAVELTLGGREIWRRTRRPVSTCNALAALAGIGSPEVL